MVERNQGSGLDQAMDWVFGNLAAGTEDSLATDIRNINNELDNYTSALGGREVVQQHDIPEVSSSTSRPAESANNYTTALVSRGEVVHRIPENPNSNPTSTLGSRDVQQHRIQEPQGSNSPMGSRDVQQQTHRIPEVSNSRSTMTSREVVQTHRIPDVPTSNSRNPMGGREVVQQHRMSDVPQQPNSRTIDGRDVRSHDMPEVSNSNTRPTESMRVAKEEQVSPPLQYQEQGILYPRGAGNGGVSRKQVEEKKDSDKDNRNFSMNENPPIVGLRHNINGKQVHLNHPSVAQNNNIHPAIPNPAAYGPWLDLSLPPPPAPSRNNLPLPPPPPPQPPQSRNNFPPSRPYWPVAWGCWWSDAATAPSKLRKPSDIEDSEKEITSRSPESNMRDASTITSPGDVQQHVLSTISAISPDRSYAALLQNGVNIDKFCNFNMSYNKEHHCRKLYFATDHFVRNLNNQNSSPSSTSSSSSDIASNLKDFICNICSRQFGSKEAFLQHEKTHMRIKEFDCHICSKSFTQKSSLSTHLKIHTGERDFVCNICNKTFSQKGSLLTHLKIHSGHKDFLCCLCNKAFSQKSTLLIHMKIHSGTKDFVCNICKKTFTQKGSLSIHLKTHSGVKDFVCSICKKAFTQKGSLQIHQKIHRGEKDFICPICNKAFTQKGSLLTHEKIHRGVKDFICSICNKAFTQKVSLLTHAKTHLCHDDFNSASKEYSPSPKDFHSSPKDYITSKDFNSSNICNNGDNKAFIQECQLINQSKSQIGE